MLIATALKHMLAAGLPHDQIVAAVAEMEAARGPESQAERKRAYDRAYQQRRRAERGRTTSAASHDSLPSSPSPTPPSLTTNPIPPSPPKGGSSPKGEARPHRRARAKTRVPEDWSPRPEDLAMAEAEGLTAGEIERELARMRDWQFRYGRTDWDAVFRNWIRNAIHQRPRHDPRPDHPASGKLAARQANFERAIGGFATVAGRLSER